MSAKRKDNKGRVLRNGEVQRSDGKYMYRYVDSFGVRQTLYSWTLMPTDKLPDGKRPTECLRDMEKRVQRDLDDGILSKEASQLTVDQLFENFMSVRIDLRETTRYDYKLLYKKHASSEIGEKAVSSVRYSDIQRMYIALIKIKGLKPSSVQSLHAVIYQMFEMAVRDNLIRTNPSANATKNLSKLVDDVDDKRHALTEDQQTALVNFVYSSKCYERYGPLITVLLGTGMRIGEALGLRINDCNFDAGIISVNHALQYKPSEKENGKYRYRISKTKTKSGVREIPMFADVRFALWKEYNKPRPSTKFTVDGYTDFIFLNSNGNVYTPGAIFTVLQNITGAYNKEETKLAEQEGREPRLLPKFSPHILRHTFCTRMCENEPNIKVVQDVMGHKHSRTTMDVYNEAMESKKVSSFANLEGKIMLA